MSYKKFLANRGLYLEKDASEFTTEELLDAKTRLENELKLLFKVGETSMRTTLAQINRELERRQS